MLVDAGDVAGPQPATGPARGLFLLEMAKTLGYDALTFGPADAVLGEELLRSLAADDALPLVSANLTRGAGDGLLLPASRIVERGGVRVAVTAVTTAAGAEAERLAEAGVGMLDPRAALAGLLPELRKRADLVILLARMPLSEAKVLGEGFPDLVDVVVVGALEPGRGVVGPENGGAVYVTAGDRGQALGRVRVGLDGRNRPARIAADEILLTTDYPESPGVREMVDGFAANLNEMLKEEAVRTAQGRAAPDGSYYVGDVSCGTCHAREHEIWAETPHAHAFQTLKDARSEALPECFRCHVTGAGDPAGYVPGGSESLQNVQCEVCHGKGSHHARDGSWGRPLRETLCVGCHDEGNSPDFDPEVYWLMIEH